VPLWSSASSAEIGDASSDTGQVTTVPAARRHLCAHPGGRMRAHLRDPSTLPGTKSSGTQPTGLSDNQGSLACLPCQEQIPERSAYTTVRGWISGSRSTAVQPQCLFQFRNQERRSCPTSRTTGYLAIPSMIEARRLKVPDRLLLFCTSGMADSRRSSPCRRATHALTSRTDDRPDRERSDEITTRRAPRHLAEHLSRPLRSGEAIGLYNQRQDPSRRGHSTTRGRFK